MDFMRSFLGCRYCLLICMNHEPLRLSIRNFTCTRNANMNLNGSMSNSLLSPHAQVHSHLNLIFFPSDDYMLLYISFVNCLNVLAG